MRTALLAAGLVLLAGRAADACKCATEPSDIEALGVADAVLIGTVVDQWAFLHIEGVYTGPAIEYDVVVHQAWKGVAGRRISLRRTSPCSAAFDVGKMWLMYAMRSGGQLFVTGCLPTRGVDSGERAVAALGAPAVTFGGGMPLIAPSLPLSRRLRAHVIGGVGVHAYWLTNMGVDSPPWDALVLPSIALVLTMSALIGFARRRWRAGAWLVASATALVVAQLAWTGHAFLASDWSEPFLRW
jgi:hypothetical protein